MVRRRYKGAGGVSAPGGAPGEVPGGASGGDALRRHPLKELDEEGGGGDEEYSGDGYARDDVGGGVFARGAALISRAGEQGATDESSRACDEGQRAPFADVCRQKSERERRGETNERGDAKALRRALLRKSRRAHVVVRDKLVKSHSEELRDLFHGVDGGQPAVVLPLGDRRARHIKLLRKLVLSDPILSSEVFEFFSECHFFLPDAALYSRTSFRFDIILRPIRTFVTTLSVTSAFLTPATSMWRQPRNKRDGADMFNLGLDRPILNIYACVVAQPRPR